jgi:hypothetical protein
MVQFQYLTQLMPYAPVHLLTLLRHALVRQQEQQLVQGVPVQQVEQQLALGALVPQQVQEGPAQLLRRLVLVLELHVL